MPAFVRIAENLLGSNPGRAAEEGDASHRQRHRRPWLATITDVPAYTDTGLKVVVSYSGAWSVPTNGGFIGGESSSFSLPANTSTIVPVDLEVGQVPN